MHVITVEKRSVMLTVVETWAKGYRILGSSQLLEFETLAEP